MNQHDVALQGIDEAPRLGVARRWPTAAVLGTALIVCYLLVVAIDARTVGNIRTGDTDNLVQGTRVLIDCFRAGDLVGCGRYEDSVQTQIFPYPLLQYLPALPLVWLRSSDIDVLIALRWLSSVSVIAIFGLFAFAFRNRPRLLWLSWPVLAGSSLMYHANAAFGEALAAAVLVGAVVAAALRRPVLLFALACLASLGKETAGPFVVVLCLLCARDSPDRVLPSGKLLWSCVLGAVAGIALSAWFNVIRFGGPRNMLYLDGPLQTAGTTRKIEWFAALWFSPAGGLVWFWPGFVVVLVTSVVVALRTHDRRRRYLGLVPAAALVCFLAGLALWFAPFGWLTFGPRLAVPLLPATLFTVLWTDGDRVVDALSRRVLAPVVIVFVALLSMPLYGAPWRWLDAVVEMISGSGSCPPLTDLSIYDDSAQYYRCTSATMWRTSPQMLDDAVARGLSIALAGSVMALIGSVLALVCALGVGGLAQPSASTVEDAGTGAAGMPTNG